MNQAKKTSSNKYNWKLIIFLLVVLSAVFVVRFDIYKKFMPRKTTYCYFQQDLNDSLPRTECVDFKIISRDTDRLDVKSFLAIEGIYSGCVETPDNFPKCTGTSYYLLKVPLSSFCKEKPCDIDGVVCAAYYVSYAPESANSSFVGIYESTRFDAKFESEGDMLKQFEECGIDG